jgi:hypothetical protein
MVRHSSGICRSRACCCSVAEGRRGLHGRVACTEGGRSARSPVPYRRRAFLTPSCRPLGFEAPILCSQSLKAVGNPAGL